jgi:hypothetical protein
MVLLLASDGGEGMADGTVDMRVRKVGLLTRDALHGN